MSWKDGNLPNTKCGDIRSRIDILLITCIVFSRPTTPASTAELEIAGREIDATGEPGLVGASFEIDLGELCVLEAELEWCFENHDNGPLCFLILVLLAVFALSKSIWLYSWYDGAFEVAV